MNIQKTMKNAFLKAALGLLISGAIFTACSKDDTDIKETKPPETGKPMKEISGTLTGEVKFYADTVYLLKGFVKVGQDDGTTILATGKLTIEPGTLIFGDRETKGTLIIQRGSQIFAQGEANNPIVFTSERGVGLKQPGDWGGVVICGRAKNNIPGGTAQLEGAYGAFHGGNDDDDNSGIFKYVRIEYAGIAINPNEEVNSLTMGSVGRGTIISHVQASYGLDDAFEWFGGTVNCTNLVAYRGLDDDFDVDLGYRGNVQFALGIRDANYADQSGSNGFEVDNNGSGSGDQPFTAPTFSNVTLIGPKANRETTISTNFQHALHLRRNNKIKIYNSFFTGYPWGIYIDGSSTESNATNGDLIFKNNIIAAVENWGGNGFGGAGSLYVNNIVGIDGETGEGKQHPTVPRGVPYRVGTSSAFDLKTWVEANNTFLPKWEDAGISASIFEVGSPNVLPTAGSLLLNDANFTGLTGLTTVAYRGAFGTENWTSGWAEFNPNAKDYSK
ncbi:MAG TPA: hypothetical protein VLZ75_10200 [Chitinophagales bacterium]|nr:hypothetical protein [Chitinophagales bacterium]